jgi:glycosidase
MAGPKRHPAWVDHAVWWHTYPLGLLGAPIREPDDERWAGRGGGVPSLGGDASAAGAQATAPARFDALVPWLDHAVSLGANGLALGPIFASTSHGYDTVDHLRIDPRLGDDAAFDRLVVACRERGLHLMLDGVFNHVGREHAIARGALGGDPASPYAGWLRRDDEGRPVPFEGHGALVTLDHDRADVAAWVADVMTHWLDRGADAWRLDAAYAVPPAFWARVLPAVRAAHPDAWVVGEVLHGDYADVVAASGMDSVTQYELWKAVWSSLLDANFFELDWTLRRHGDLLDAFVPATFVGNHDVTRLASRVGPERAVLAHLVLLTVGGVPSVYYGDELGLTGVKEDREGGDDAVRPALAVPGSWDDGAAWMLRHVQRLVGLRRRHPWLVTARTTTLELTNTRYVYRAEPGPGRQGAAGGSSCLVVELDLTGDRPTGLVRDAAGALLLDALAD